MTLYDLLGVPTDADAPTIHAAYRRAAKTTHPDQGGDRAAWDRLRLAHDVLTDEERRAAYTGWLLGQAAGQQNAGMANPFINSRGSFP